MNSLRLAVVQFTPEWGNKEKNLSKIHDMTESLNADLIVLPELCTTGYYFLSREEVAGIAEPAAGPTGEFFKEMATRLDAAIVAGFAEQDGGKYYIACLIVLPEEEKPRVYRKTHLFYKETYCFDPGNTGFFVVNDSRRDVRIGPMICYDWRFPESARILTLLGADVIVCPSNLVTEAWKQVMPARAIENNVYLAVANRTGTEVRNEEELVFKGNSAIYDYHGQVVQKGDAIKEEILTAEIFPWKTRDKSFNSINDVLRDRKPYYYQPLVITRAE
ncbi:nitrilase-related carbon-nitrogen hydrolase [Thermodesulfobacteriota bacterium]